MHTDAAPIHVCNARIEINEQARDRAGAQMQADLDGGDALVVGGDGGADAFAMFGDQLDIGLREVMGVGVDGSWDGHGVGPLVGNGLWRLDEGGT